MKKTTPLLLAGTSLLLTLTACRAWPHHNPHDNPPHYEKLDPPPQPHHPQPHHPQPQPPPQHYPQPM